MNKYCSFKFCTVNNEKKGNILFRYKKVTTHKNMGQKWYTFHNCICVTVSGPFKVDIFQNGRLRISDGICFLFDYPSISLPEEFYKERKFNAIDDDAAKLIFEVNSV